MLGDGTNSVTWSRVTPFAVAPPLSPDQYGTQGGDCGSSICLGGSPTQRRTRATSTACRAISSALTCSSSAEVSLDAPPGVAARSPVESVICSTACGANSAMVGGG